MQQKMAHFARWGSNSVKKAYPTLLKQDQNVIKISNVVGFFIIVETENSAYVVFQLLKVLLGVALFFIEKVIFKGLLYMVSYIYYIQSCR